MSKIEWICDNCVYNGGQYCTNVKFASNYEKCKECEGFIKDMDNPGDFVPEDLGVNQDEPNY